MSDDFMADLSDAVDNGGKSSAPEQPIQTPQQDVTNPVTETDTTNDNAAIEKSVLDALGESEFEKEERIAKEEKARKIEEDNAKQKEKEDAEKAASPEGKEQQTDEQKAGKASTSFNENTPYLDRFLREDKKGNLLGPDGKVIIPAGPARHWYEKVKKEGRDQRDMNSRLAISTQQLGDRFKELYKEYQRVADGGFSMQTLAQQTGMEEKEVSEAINLMKQYKSDPITAIKSLLTQAQMNGIDLSKIGVSGGADPAAMKQMFTNMLQEHIAPISQTYQEQRRSQEIQNQIAEFWQEFPDLQEHEETIAEAKRRAPEMSLREIGLRYRAWLQQNPQQPPQQQQQAPVSRTYPRQNPAQQPRYNVVTPPKQRDFANMSFKEIAQSIIEES